MAMPQPDAATSPWPFPSAALAEWLEKVSAEAKGASTAPYPYEPGVELPQVVASRPLGVASQTLATEPSGSWGVRLEPAPGFDVAAQAALAASLHAPLVLSTDTASVYPQWKWDGGNLAADPLPYAIERNQLASASQPLAATHTLADVARVASWGATASQQLAWGVARLLGTANPSSAPVLLLSVGPNLLLEVAKLRAARVLLAVQGLAHTQLWAETDRTAWSATDPTTNLVRQGLQAFAAFSGGCDCLFVLPHTPMATPFALRLCCTLPQVLLHETHTARVTDPLAGAYAIEHLTHSLVQAAEALLKRVEAFGGFLSALEAGWMQAEITAAAAKKASAVKGQSLIGVSAYPPPTAAMGKVDTTDYFYPAFDPTRPHPHPWGTEATYLAATPT